jgi:hypothetical protein
MPGNIEISGERRISNMSALGSTLNLLGRDSETATWLVAQYDKGSHPTYDEIDQLITGYKVEQAVSKPGELITYGTHRDKKSSILSYKVGRISQTPEVRKEHRAICIPLSGYVEISRYVNLKEYDKVRPRSAEGITTSTKAAQVPSEARLQEHRHEYGDGGLSNIRYVEVGDNHIVTRLGKLEFDDARNIYNAILLMGKVLDITTLSRTRQEMLIEYAQLELKNNPDQLNEVGITAGRLSVTGLIDA